MQFFSKVLSKDLFFFLIQYLQMTCDSNTQCDTIFLENTSYKPVLFPNSILAEDMRQPYSVWCNNSRKKGLHTCCFSYFSYYRWHATAILSVMQFFSKILLTDLFFFLIQYLQMTCDSNTQCDAITLKKSFTNLSFLLLQFLQRTCERHTQCDAITLEKVFWYLLFLQLQSLQRTWKRHTQCDAIFLKSTF